MNLKKLLPVALVGLIGVSSPACKPTQDKHRADVERILSAIEPAEEKTLASRQYYKSRNDLQNVSTEEISSLAMSHAKLSAAVELFKSDKMSKQDFLTILRSKESIVTDKNTKLKISTNFGRDIGFLSCRGDELLVRTESHSPDKILRVSSTDVKMEGGEVIISFSGIEFETKARENKEQLSASTDVVEVGPATYTISSRLVLAK